MSWLAAARPGRIALSCLLGASLLAGACGGQGAFPEAAPCDPPQPTPRPATNSADATESIYRNIVISGMTVLESTTQTHRSEWPFERPSSDLEFRQAYVDYTRTVICTAEYLRDLEAPSSRFAEFDTAYDAAMDETIEVAEFGRDAVKARNTSRFREWIERVEAMPGRYDQVLETLPRRQ